MFLKLNLLRQRHQHLLHYLSLFLLQHLLHHHPQQDIRRQSFLRYFHRQNFLALKSLLRLHTPPRNLLRRHPNHQHIHCLAQDWLNPHRRQLP